MTYDTRLWEMQQVTAQAEQYRMNQSTSKKNINDYSEALFQSIDTIVGERIKRLPYDYTIVATITNADNAYVGAYKVTTDNNTTFTAYSEVKTYNVGDRVYIRIVDTNYNSSKIITGKYIEHVNVSDISSSDIIDYLIQDSNPKKYLHINKEFAAQGYYLVLEGANDDSNNAYSPDQEIPINPKLNVKLYQLSIENNEFIAKELQSGYTYIYGINDGTQVFNNNIILEGQYDTITTPQSLNTQIDFSFIPIQQTVQQYVSVRCYITLTSGIIIRSNVFIIKSDITLSKEYRRFTITADSDQFFIFNARGQRINSDEIIITLTINYINTLDSNAAFKSTDNIKITSSNSNTMFTSLTPTWHLNNSQTATTSLSLKSNAQLNKSFLVETLIFTITKDNVKYPALTKDFYFGYQQIDSVTNSDSIKLYLNNNDILNYYKLKIGNLFEAGPGETVKIGGSNYAVTNGNWAGNAATATTATKLAAAPSLAASGNKITITAGEQTSAAFTVPFATMATTATTATELADAPSLAADGNKITITAGGKTSAAFTVPYASTAAAATTADKINTNAGSLTTPIYFTGGVPAVITSLDETLLGFNSSNSNFSSNGQNTKLYGWLKAIQTNMNTLAAEHNITLTWPATL